MTRLSFTQPICFYCYALRYPGREPVRIKDASAEMCCDCAMQTTLGIYVRVDPTTVKFPTREKDS